MGLTSLQVCMDMDSASDQHHHWLQTTMHEDPLMDSSSSPSAGDMLGPIMMSERRLRPPQDQALKCPRCDSTHTKFCYYNNYSLSQPRYFCKTCRRYWTKGGTLRNIPVGGGFRKNRKSSSSSKKLPSSEQQLQTQPVSVSSINSQMNPNPNPMMMMMCLPNPVDLQLSFQTDPFSQLPSMIASGSGYSESMLFNNIASLENNSIRPMDFCLDHKGEAVVMNTSKNNNSNHGYFSSHFGGGGGQYVMSNNHHDNLGYAQDLGLSYIDNNSAAQLDYPRLHEHIPMDREVKPNKKMLALEWQQEEACSDARNSRESFGYLGSWSGMSSAGNYHHQQQQLLPSSTTNNSLV